MKSDYEVSLERQSPVVLSVKHVAKSFRLPTEQASGLKMAFLNCVARHYVRCPTR